MPPTRIQRRCQNTPSSVKETKEEEGRSHLRKCQRIPISETETGVEEEKRHPRRRRKIPSNETETMRGMQD